MGRNFRELTYAGPVVLDYIKQPLPLIGVWSNYNNSNFGLGIYDSDLQQLSRTTNTNYTSFSNELSGAYSSYTYTTGQVSSNGWTSSTIKHTWANSVDGNAVIQATPDASWSLKAPNNNSLLYFGVVVGPEGYRQNFSLYAAGSALRQTVRGSTIPLDSFSITTSHATMVQTTGWNSCQGQIGYNRNTNTLVWLEPQNSNGTIFRAHIWKNPNRKLTGRPGELRNFITEAKAGTNNASYRYADFNWASSFGAASTTEGAYRARVIPCGNEQIAITRFNPSSRIEMGVLTLGANNTGTFAYQLVVATTTSYGSEQVSCIGMKHNISWDNKWLIAYAPYYYYGAGIVSFMINTDNPSTYYTFSYLSSSDGVQVIPFRNSGFAVCYSENNADGYGLYFGHLDVSTGFDVLGNALAVTGPVSNPELNPYYLDTAYTSTNYPCLVAVDRWSVPIGG